SNGGAVQKIDLKEIEGDFFLAIHAHHLRGVYALWVQLANENRAFDRQAIAKKIAHVLENAEFFFVERALVRPQLMAGLLNRKGGASLVTAWWSEHYGTFGCITP